MMRWPGRRSQTRPLRCSRPWPVGEGSSRQPSSSVGSLPTLCLPEPGRHWLPGGRAGSHKTGWALSVLCSQGDQFLFYEDWGENMVSKGTPVLCVLDIESGNISVLEGVPESVSPGQVSADLACITPGVWGPCLSDCPCSHLPCGLVYRPSGPLETQVWCSQAGGMSPSGWASASAPIGGEDSRRWGAGRLAAQTGLEAQCLSGGSRSALYYVDLTGGNCGTC